MLIERESSRRTARKIITAARMMEEDPELRAIFVSL